MEYKELDVFVKYCANQINMEKFVELMLLRYNDRNYIENLWGRFRDNSTMFIVSRSEVELFEAIQKEIKDKNYEG